MVRARGFLAIIVLAGAAVLPSASVANPPGFALSLAGPAEYEPGVPVTFSGALSVLDTAGLPLQNVELLVDGDSVAVAQTDLAGAWSVMYTFNADPPSTHAVKAVAFGGLPLETQSETLMVARAVVIASISVTPQQPITLVGDSEQFTALGTFSDGSVADVTQTVTWSSSDTAVATVSNASGSQGLASAIQLGTTTITATQDSIIGTATMTVVGAGLVINEVDYDQPGTDTEEFIEILNTASTPVDLDGIAIVLVNGATNAEYARVNLSGVLAAGAYAVVGSGIAVPGGTQTFPMTPGSLQNGAPDGIALFDTVTLTMLDALSYEGAMNAAVITGAGTYSLVEGTPVSEADSGTVPGSLARLPDGADSNNADSDWGFSATVTPGAQNVP